MPATRPVGGATLDRGAAGQDVPGAGATSYPWARPGVEVVHRTAGTQPGVILRMTLDGYAVCRFSPGHEMTVLPSMLEPAIPKKNDKVIILAGSLRHQTGTLLTIEDVNGVSKGNVLVGSNLVKQVDFQDLARLRAQ
eukprot:jgi/Mesvir1/7071/Mv09183-RA.1